MAFGSKDANGQLHRLDRRFDLVPAAPGFGGLPETPAATQDLRAPWWPGRPATRLWRWTCR